MKAGEYLGKRLEEFHWGMVIAQKFMWIINVTILFKVFNLHHIYYIIILPILVVLVWITGKIINSTGIKEAFIKEYYKGSEIHTTGEKN